MFTLKWRYEVIENQQPQPRKKEPKKTNVSCTILPLSAANVIDLGRQSETSHNPRANAGIEKTACNPLIAKRIGELETIIGLLLKGSIVSTAENPTNQADITTSIEISCRK